MVFMKLKTLLKLNKDMLLFHTFYLTGLPMLMLEIVMVNNILLLMTQKIMNLTVKKDMEKDICLEVLKSITHNYQDLDLM